MSGFDDSWWKKVAKALTAHFDHGLEGARSRRRSLATWALVSAWIVTALGLTLFLIFSPNSELAQNQSVRTLLLAEALHEEALKQSATLRLGRDEDLLPWRERIDPTAWLPRSFDLEFGEVANLARYERACWDKPPSEPTSPGLHKYWVWAKAICTELPLTTGFFKEPPYIHPLGSSYVARAEQLNLPYAREAAWQKATAPYRHLRENRPAELRAKEAWPWDILQNVEDEAISALFLAQTLVVGHTYTFASVDAERPGFSYHVFSSAPFLEAVKRLGFTLAPSRNPRCIKAQGQGCWMPVERFLSRSSIAIGVAIFLAISSIVLLLTVISLRQTRKMRERYRMMAFHTLAHEIRTPVSGIVLATELMRETFDQMTEKGQDAYLRLCDDALRLARVIKSSEQYLRSDGVERKVNLTLRPNLRDELDHLLDAHRDKIAIELDESLECPFSTDYFWLEICLKNLVENALRHGVSPICVLAKIKDDFLAVEVRDAGVVPDMTLAHIVKPFIRRKEGPGTGLGLAIVDQVCKQLGGRLTYQGPPTVFTLFIANQPMR